MLEIKLTTNDETIITDLVEISGYNGIDGTPTEKVKKYLIQLIVEDVNNHRKLKSQRSATWTSISNDDIT
jgi:hypothetical protein